MVYHILLHVCGINVDGGFVEGVASLIELVDVQPPGSLRWSSLSLIDY